MGKGQVEAITLVLITGIVMSLAGAAYFWGKPLIEKRASITDIATAESFMIQLDKEIVDVARNRGEKSINIPALSGASLLADDTNNSVIFGFLVNQPMLAFGDDTAPVPIESVHIDLNGTYGESPRVITLEASPFEGQYRMTLRSAYRTLFTNVYPYRAYRIDLSAGGKTGNNKVSVSYGGTETEAIVFDGRSIEVVKTIINVRIS